MGLVKESLATRMPTVTEHWKGAESANVKLVGREMDKTALVRLIVKGNFKLRSLGKSAFQLRIESNFTFA